MQSPTNNLSHHNKSNKGASACLSPVASALRAAKRESATSGSPAETWFPNCKRQEARASGLLQLFRNIPLLEKSKRSPERLDPGSSTRRLGYLSRPRRRSRQRCNQRCCTTRRQPRSGRSAPLRACARGGLRVGARNRSQSAFRCAALVPINAVRAQGSPMVGFSTKSEQDCPASCPVKK